MKHQPIELDKIQGHIVLYCKGHYDIEKINFFEGLKMIWAIRCGYDYKHTSTDTLIYIANDMYKIISKCMPGKFSSLMDNLHRELVWKIGKPKDMSAIESLIWEYGSMLSNMQIRYLPEGKKKYQWIVKLPKSKKQVFNRILRGNGRYTDYELITK